MRACSHRALDCLFYLTRGLVSDDLLISAYRFDIDGPIAEMALFAYSSTEGFQSALDRPSNGGPVYDDLGATAGAGFTARPHGDAVGVLMGAGFGVEGLDNRHDMPDGSTKAFVVQTGIFRGISIPLDTYICVA